MAEELREKIKRLHTTEQGIRRIRKNLGLAEDTDPVKWCREVILARDSVIERRGKNWYVRHPGCIITVHAGSFTVITARKEE